MNVNINEVEAIKEQLEALQENDALFIEEDGKEKYAIITSETFTKVSDLLDALDASNPINSEIKIIGDEPGHQLTYEEYERVKSLIMSAVEKAFKPKADKLN